MRAADVVTRLLTRYVVPTVPPDSHAVALVGEYAEESSTRPADTVIVDAVMISPSASHSVQSQR